MWWKGESVERGKRADTPMVLNRRVPPNDRLQCDNGLRDEPRQCRLRDFVHLLFVDVALSGGSRSDATTDSVANAVQRTRMAARGSQSELHIGVFRVPAHPPV
eukprot:gene9180-biopygen4843